MAKKDGKNKKSIIRKYIDAKGKKNLKVAALKTATEGVIGAGAGMGVGALIGKYSPIVGLLVYGFGEYFGDETNFTKAAGAGMIGYGVAKAADFESIAGKVAMNGISFGSVKEGAKERLTDFKDSWMKAFMLDKLFKKEDEGASKSEEPDESSDTMGSIDLSALDVFDNLNKQQAIRFEADRIRNEELMEEEEYDGLSEQDEYEEGYDDDEEYDEMNYAPNALEDMRTNQEIDSLQGNYLIEADEVDYDWNTL